MNQKQKMKHEAVMNEIRRLDAVRSEHKLRSIWSVGSMEKVFDLDAPHPFPGVTELAYEGHWGPELVTAPIEGPTWMHLWYAADKAIRASGDEHHVFVERFTVAVSGLLELHTGS